MQTASSDHIVKIILREFLYFFKASQFGLVYSLNVILVFLSFSVLVSIVLVNSGDFFIDIINFLLEKFQAPAELSGSYSLKRFFWYAYLSVSLVVYLIEKLLQKKFGPKPIIQTKHKIIAVPIFVCLGYSLIVYFFSLKYGFWSGSTLMFGILAVVTILANYYYLLVSYTVKYLDGKLA